MTIDYRDIARWCARVIVALCLFTFSGARAGGIEQLQYFIDRSTSGTATFQQFVYDVDGNLVQESQGNLTFLRPGRFKWFYRTPYEQVLIGDGTFLWVYDKDLEQATKVLLKDALGSSPAALLYGSKDIESYFGLEGLEPISDSERVKVTPYEESGLFERIEIALSEGVLRTMMLYDHFGQKTIIKFDGFVVPANVDANEFEFVPPEGVDIVTQ
jgi:outer membrane lipoprotein carrier protein